MNFSLLVYFYRPYFINCIMNNTDGIFLGNRNVQIIKSSSLFWKQVFVYPSLLEENGADADFINVVQPLFENNILKIVSNSATFSQNLFDKIYHNIDRDFWNFLQNNSSQICHKVELSSEEQSLSKKDAEIDCNNDKLRQIFETDLKDNLTEDFKKETEKALNLRSGGSGNRLPQEFRNKINSTISMLTDCFSSMHNTLWDKQLLIQYNTELFTQLHVSSSIFSDKFQRKYYKIKLGGAYNDNSKYLSGINSLMPIVKRESISDFSVDEIIELRKNSKWANAMLELSKICDEIKSATFTSDFKNELNLKVIQQYQEQLDQYKITSNDFLKGIGTTSAFICISMIPVVGGLISDGLSLATQISDYLIGKRNQKTLPLFLNDMTNKDL